MSLRRAPRSAMSSGDKFRYDEETLRSLVYVQGYVPVRAYRKPLILTLVSDLALTAIFECLVSTERIEGMSSSREGFLEVHR